MSFPVLPSARHAVVREARGRAFAFPLACARVSARVFVSREGLGMWARGVFAALY